MLLLFPFMCLYLYLYVSKAIWNFSENSSILVGYDHLIDVAQLLVHLGHLLLKQRAKLAISADVCLRVIVIIIKFKQRTELAILGRVAKIGQFSSLLLNHWQTLIFPIICIGKY